MNDQDQQVGAVPTAAQQDAPASPSRRRIFQAAAATGIATTLPMMAEAASNAPASAVKPSLRNISIPPCDP